MLEGLGESGSICGGKGWTTFRVGTLLQSDLKCCVPIPTHTHRDPPVLFQIPAYFVLFKIAASAVSCMKSWGHFPDFLRHPAIV